MDDLTALLAAVILHPDEDTARLAFADCVQERGDERRAQYIRESIAGGGVAYPQLVLDLAIAFGVPVDRGRTGNFHHFGFRSMSLDAEHVRFNWSRGFIDRCSCFGSTFVKHADALVWRPEQTMACPTCRGFGHFNKGNEDSNSCPEECAKYPSTGTPCDGSGRIARPCPLTAQPIRKVVLMTVPKYHFIYDWIGTAMIDGRDKSHCVPMGERYDHSGRVIAKTLCELEWPGVEFNIV